MSSEQVTAVEKLVESLGCSVKSVYVTEGYYSWDVDLPQKIPYEKIYEGVMPHVPETARIAIQFTKSDSNESYTTILSDPCGVYVRILGCTMYRHSSFADLIRYIEFITSYDIYVEQLDAMLRFKIARYIKTKQLLCEKVTSEKPECSDRCTRGGEAKKCEHCYWCEKKNCSVHLEPMKYSSLIKTFPLFDRCNHAEIDYMVDELQEKLTNTESKRSDVGIEHCYFPAISLRMADRELLISSHYDDEKRTRSYQVFDRSTKSTVSPKKFNEDELCKFVCNVPNKKRKI